MAATGDFLSEGAAETAVARLGDVAKRWREVSQLYQQTLRERDEARAEARHLRAELSRKTSTPGE